MHEANLAGAGGSRSSAGPRAGHALALLIAINMFNYIDRQILAAVEPEVRENLLLVSDPEDANAKTKMGALATAFLLSYMLIAPLFGWLAERHSRWLLIAVGVIFWSLASGASGLALTFTMLLITRCFVGIGEGAYGPVAPTLLADLYPVATRGRIMACFYAAIPVGSALGYTLGGQIAAWDRDNQSWRWAFYAVVIPGVILGVWAYLMKEPPRGAADRVRVGPGRAKFRDYQILFRTPSYVFNTLGMTAMTFSLGALGWWMPEYLKSHGAQPLLKIQPAAFFGILTATAGLLATITGGIAGDRLRARHGGSYFLVSGAGMLIGMPCALVFLCLPFPWAWLPLFAAVFFLFFNTGPTNTILANVTHPSMRATGFALNIFIIHVLGDAISPPIVGAIADRSDLTVGFAVVSLFMLLSGLLWLWGARYLERDTLAAPHRLDAAEGAT